MWPLVNGAKEAAEGAYANPQCWLAVPKDQRGSIMTSGVTIGLRKGDDLSGVVSQAIFTAAEQRPTGAAPAGR